MNLREKSLVIFKPDVLQRQIVGEFITRFERKGYKMVGMKMLQASKDIAGKHYVGDEEYLISIGEKTIKSAKERGEDVSKMDALAIGTAVRKRNLSYLTSGPVLAIVFEGPHIVEMIRKMIGSTSPRDADVGTIRADYSPDSYMIADDQDRSVKNLIHASDSPENAEKEIALWFDKSEISDYEVAIEKILYNL